MKIKLSKSQWETVGKKAGWTKVSQTEDTSFVSNEPNDIEQSKMSSQRNIRLNVAKAFQNSGCNVSLSKDWGTLTVSVPNASIQLKFEGDFGDSGRFDVMAPSEHHAGPMQTF